MIHVNGKVKPRHIHVICIRVFFMQFSSLKEEGKLEARILTTPAGFIV